jgi:hypothetical protein
MKSQKRTLNRQIAPGYTGFGVIIGWIGLALSGCATHPWNQHESNAGLSMRGASVCRHELNEALAKGELDTDVPYRSEARAAVGLTGLMGGVYAEALGVHQVSIGQSEAKQSGGLQANKNPGRTGTPMNPTHAECHD